MKKTLTFILILALLVVGASFTLTTQTDVAFADTTPTVSGAQITVHRGQTFYLDVSIANNCGLTGLLVRVKYNEKAMVLRDIVAGEALSKLNLTPMGSSLWEAANKGDGINMVWSSATGDNATADYSNGVIARLEFESFRDAEVGDYYVQLSFDPDNTNDADEHPLTIATVDGKVALKKGEYRAKFYDDDGITLRYEDDYNDKDHVVDFDNVPKPSRPTDDMYEYEFLDWVSMISDETNVLKYKALYKYTPIDYTVTFIVDGKVFDVAESAFGEDLPFPDTTRQGYLFSGWFLDENYTEKLTSTKMAPNAEHEWFVYGYYKYNVRDGYVPEITLTVVDKTDNLVTIDAAFTVNMGVVTMSLNLDYDHTNLIFKGYTLGTAFPQTGFVFLPDSYRFMFNNGVKNTTACELILRLQFEIAPTAPDGVYTVNFTYDDTRDVCYFDKDGGIALTRVNVVPALISKGTKTEWNESVKGDNDVSVGVSSSVGMEMHTELVVTDVSSSYSSTDVSATIGNDKEVKNAYQLDLTQNNVTVQPSGELEIRIKMKQHALDSNPNLYMVGENGELVAWESTVVGDEIVFTSRTLGTFVIVGDKTTSQQPPAGGGNVPSAGGDQFMSIVVTILLVIVLILLITLSIVIREKKSTKNN